MPKEKYRYEEWLTTIANTRLMFNSISELEAFLDAPSIHSNGIKRCFSSLQQQRSAFRDLKVETDIMTDGATDLETLLISYRRSWEFFKANLARRSDPFAVALELLRYSYPPHSKNGLGRKKLAVFEQIGEQGLSVPLLALMLLKAIPGYDSKEGDVIEFPRQYEYAMSLLDRLAGDGGLFENLPVIELARQERNKTRLMLFYHFSRVLDVYEQYASQESMYDSSIEGKAGRIPLEMEGFWNECGGKLDSTEFWEFQETVEAGSFFATFWHKDAGNNLTGIRYFMVFIEGREGSLVSYMVHPEFLKHRMKGIPLGDTDHTWYSSEMPEDVCPDVLSLERALPSTAWRSSLKLTRVKDPKVCGTYRRWLERCNIVKPFGSLEYTFHPYIYAITQDSIYIPAQEDHQYFRIPKSSIEGADRIQMDDMVGLMTLPSADPSDGTSRQYIVFDDFLLYIPLTRSEMRKYGIRKVDHIE